MHHRGTRAPTLAVVEVAGTWLQLLGVLITIGGLRYVWTRVVGLFARMRSGLAGRIAQIRSNVVRAARDVQLAGDGALTVEVQVVAEATVTRGSTPGERLGRLERDFQEQAAHFRKALDELPEQINEAITDGLADYGAEETVLQAKDLVPTLVGLAVSGSGLILQLVAHYVP
jgi:hypothetical protein